jgi:hypothetical protein
MTFGFAEAGAIAAYSAFILFNLRFERPKDEDDDSRWVWALWMLIELIGSVLLIVTMYAFTVTSTPDSWQLIVGYVMLFVHIGFGMIQRSMLTFSISYWISVLVMIGTAATFFFVVIFDGASRQMVSIGTFSAYVFLWICTIFGNWYRSMYDAKKGYYEEMVESGISNVYRPAPDGTVTRRVSAVGYKGQ